MRLMRKPLSRRTVLRGSGTAIALPFMGAMAATSRAADISERPRRLQVFYSPNGMIMDPYRPKTFGRDYALTPTLEPLAAHREDFSIITGLGHPQADAMGDPPAGHGRSCPAFLTGAHARATEGPDIRCGISMDQVFARHLGDATQLSSLELGIDQASLLGSCDINYSCAYTNGISWLTPTVPLPVTANPRAVFERLFGDGEALDPAARAARLAKQSSILDYVMDDVRRLSGELGMEDNRKLDEYLDATRALERRIERAASSPPSPQAAGLVAPTGIPEDFAEHVKLMIDLQILALQADITRVSTFMIGRELSNRTYPEIGVPDSHHMLSHHGNLPDKMAKLADVNRYHMEFFAYMLARMKETPDGEGSLFDRTFIIRGAAFGDSNEHDNHDLPVIVSGGLVKGGNHVSVEKGTSMSNLMLSGLRTLGVPAASFGDSTGPLAGFADV